MVRLDALEARLERLKVSEKSLAALRPQKHHDYWFSDGNIVLVAQGQVAYRVHCSIFVRKSNVFKNLLTLPHSTDNEFIEGYPVLYLEDNPGDFDVLVGLLYDGWSYYRNSAHATWKTVKSMIVLGDKYDIPELRDDGLRQLEQLFPSEISRWDDARHTKTRFTWEGGISYQKEDIISMAAVTFAAQVPRLHATILYQCISFDIAIIAAAIITPAAPSFSPLDFRHILALREKLPSLWSKFHNDMFETLPDAYCRSLTGCGQTFKMLRDTYIATDETDPKQAVYTSDPLYRNAWDDVFAEADCRAMCKNCVALWRRRHMQLRQEFLDSIPAVFGYVLDEHRALCSL